MGASLSSFGCSVFESWVLRFRDLGASFSRFGCFVFEIWVLRTSFFVFEFFVFETTNKPPNFAAMIVRVSRRQIFFGVTLDENLNWKSEISHVANKVAKALGIICKCSFFLPKTSLRIPHYSLTYPHFHEACAQYTRQRMCCRKTIAFDVKFDQNGEGKAISKGKTAKNSPLTSNICFLSFSALLNWCQVSIYFVRKKK